MRVELAQVRVLVGRRSFQFSSWGVAVTFVGNRLEVEGYLGLLASPGAGFIRACEALGEVVEGVFSSHKYR